jgi:hypothetical protein
MKLTTWNLSWFRFSAIVVWSLQEVSLASIRRFNASILAPTDSLLPTTASHRTTRKQPRSLNPTTTSSSLKSIAQRTQSCAANMAFVDTRAFVFLFIDVIPRGSLSRPSR